MRYHFYRVDGNHARHLASREFNTSVKALNHAQYLCERGWAVQVDDNVGDNIGAVFNMPAEGS